MACPANEWRIDTWYERVENPGDTIFDNKAVGYRVVKGEGAALIVAPDGCFRVNPATETSVAMQFMMARELRDFLNVADATLAAATSNPVSDAIKTQFAPHPGRLYRNDGETDDSFRDRIRAAIRSVTLKS